MKANIRAGLVRTIAAAALLTGSHGLAEAAMMHAPPPGVVQQQQSSNIQLVRHRIVHHKVYRRRARGVGPAAVLGLFGAIVGAGIAQQRYDSYSYGAYGQPYYSYGQPNYYYAQPYGYAAPHPYMRRHWRR